jgi:hypothetical protein
MKVGHLESIWVTQFSDPTTQTITWSLVTSHFGVIIPKVAPGVRLKVRTNSRVEVPIGQEHWSVRS